MIEFHFFEPGVKGHHLACFGRVPLYGLVSAFELDVGEGDTLSVLGFVAGHISEEVVLVFFEGEGAAEPV